MLIFYMQWRNLKCFYKVTAIWVQIDSALGGSVRSKFLPRLSLLSSNGISLFARAAQNARLVFDECDPRAKSEEFILQDAPDAQFFESHMLPLTLFLHHGGGIILLIESRSVIVIVISEDFSKTVFK